MTTGGRIWTNRPSTSLVMTMNKGDDAGGHRRLTSVNGADVWTLREVLDQHDVALRLVVLGVEYPTAVGRGGESRAAPEKFLVESHDPRRSLRGEAVELDRQVRARFRVEEVDALLPHGPRALPDLVRDLHLLAALRGHTPQ